MNKLTSRRAALIGAAALSALGLPAIGSPVDPVFAAIEKHREAEAAWNAAKAALDEFDERYGVNLCMPARIKLSPLHDWDTVLVERTEDSWVVRQTRKPHDGEFSYASCAGDILREASDIPEADRAA